MSDDLARVLAERLGYEMGRTGESVFVRDLARHVLASGVVVSADKVRALDVESLARRLADTVPDSGDHCFDEDLRQGDPEMWTAHEEDREYYRKWARSLLSEPATDAAPTGEAQTRKD